MQITLSDTLAAGTYTITPMGAGSVPLVVFMTEDAYQGDAIAAITLDGVALSPVTVKALRGSTPQAVPLGNVDPAKAHTVVVTFTNDAYGGSASADRNLYVVSYQLGTAAAVACPATLEKTGASTTINIPAAS